MAAATSWQDKCAPGVNRKETPLHKVLSGSLTLKAVVPVYFIVYCNSSICNVASKALRPNIVDNDEFLCAIKVQYIESKIQDQLDIV